MSRPVLCPLVALTLLLPPARGAEKLPVTGSASARLAPVDELLISFVRDNEVPGAALALAKNGKLVYERGFGYADPERRLPVQPRARFRIASISKPITAVAILRLIEQGKLRLDDPVFDLLALPTPPGRQRDPRLDKVTVRQLLEHTGGWDRSQSFDPMFRPLLIAKELGTAPPAGPAEVIHYMLGQPLDFDPGSRHAYSNFGYCVLGRVIEKLTGKSYESHVQEAVLAPLGIRDMQIGKTLEAAPGEVRYVAGKTARAVVGPDVGQQVAAPYGAWYLEAMDAHGGWIASAADLVRFASAFEPPERCPILKAETIRTMYARPRGPAGAQKGKGDVYYALGWAVRELAPGKISVWHAGALDGTATMMLRRHDGLCWAALFNTRTNPGGEHLGSALVERLHAAADRVRWDD